jgi:hypothetical protein
MVQNITFDKGNIVGSIQPLLRASLLKIQKKKKSMNKTSVQRQIGRQQYNQLQNQKCSALPNTKQKKIPNRL